MGWVDSATKSNLEPYKYIKTFDFGIFDYATENIDTVMNTFSVLCCRWTPVVSVHIYAHSRLVRYTVQ